jgi:hypothetical protein
MDRQTLIEKSVLKNSTTRGAMLNIPAASLFSARLAFDAFSGANMQPNFDLCFPKLPIEFPQRKQNGMIVCMTGRNKIVAPKLPHPSHFLEEDRSL